jgi:hypothetical protein
VKKDRQILYVEFDDHASSTGWQESDKADMSLVRIKAVGFKIAETDDQILLALAEDIHQGLNTARLWILKSAITKKKRISL